MTLTHDTSNCPEGSEGRRVRERISPTNRGPLSTGFVCVCWLFFLAILLCSHASLASIVPILFPLSLFLYPTWISHYFFFCLRNFPLIYFLYSITDYISLLLSPFHILFYVWGGGERRSRSHQLPPPLVYYLTEQRERERDKGERERIDRSLSFSRVNKVKCSSRDPSPGGGGSWSSIQIRQITCPRGP